VDVGVVRNKQFYGLAQVADHFVGGFACSNRCETTTNVRRKPMATVPLLVESLNIGQATCPSRLGASKVWLMTGRSPLSGV
jgi:hypothetical protein